MYTLSHDASRVNGANQTVETCKGWKQRDRIKRSRLGCSDKAVLDALLHHTNDAHFQGTGNRLAWPEQIDIEIESGLSNKSVRRALTRLVAAGVVTITRQRGADGRLGRNYYTLHLDQLVPAERPARKASRPAQPATSSVARNDSSPVVNVTDGPAVTVTDGDEGDQRSLRPIYNNRETNTKEHQQGIGAAADLEAAWAREKRGDYPGVRNWDAFRRSQIAKGIMPQRDDDFEERAPQKLEAEAHEPVDHFGSQSAKAYFRASMRALESGPEAARVFRERYPTRDSWVAANRHLFFDGVPAT